MSELAPGLYGNPTPELFSALAAAQAELQPVSKDAANSHFRSEYATLGSVISSSRAVLAKYGLSVLQPPFSSAGGVGVWTIIGHCDGGWIAAPCTLPLDKATPQGAGSAITYARRYGLKSALRLADEDDDAEAAEGRTVPALNIAPKPATVKDRNYLFEISSSGSLEELSQVATQIKAANLPTSEKMILTKAYEERKKALGGR